MKYQIKRFEDKDNLSKILNEEIPKCSSEYFILINSKLKLKESEESVIDKYINLLESLQLPFALYGFYNSNRLFNGNPNPSLNLILEGDYKIFINRQADNGFLIFKTEIFKKLDLPYFDENIKHKFMLVFSKKLQILNLYNYFGFFFDIHESFNYFEHKQKDLSEKEYLNYVQEINKEMKYIEDKKIDLTMLPNIDNLLKGVKETYEASRK